MTQEKLLYALDTFEKRHDIRIYACRDFGSRAKGLAGPDSDRDALFLFDQPTIQYKMLQGETDSICTEENGIDFQGWSTHKFADLLSDSNPTAIEFLNSPERYYEDSDPRIESELESIETYATRNFKPIALYYHYKSLAERQYRKHIKSTPDTTSDPTIKRNLVAIRAIACAEYIESKLEFPPMEITELLDSDDALPEECREILTSLTQKKHDGRGSEMLGNKYEAYFERWLDGEPNHDRLDIQGIGNDRCDTFIRRITHALY